MYFYTFPNVFLKLFIDNFGIKAITYRFLVGINLENNKKNPQYFLSNWYHYSKIAICFIQQKLQTKSSFFQGILLISGQILLMKCEK